MDFLNRLKIGARLAAAFTILLILLSAVAAFGGWKIAATNQHVVDFADNIVPSLRVVDKLRATANDLRRVESQHLLLASDKEKDEFDARIAKTQKTLEGLFAEYDKLAVDQVEVNNLKAARAAAAAYAAQWVKLRVLSREAMGDPAKLDEARKLLFGESRTSFGALSASIDTIWAYNETLSGRATQSAASDFRMALAWMGSLALAAVLIGIGFGWWITRSITTPLRQAMTVAERIGSGDLGSQVEVRGSDETGQLLAGLKRMNESLIQIVSQVRNSSDSIATGSAQIATGNADLSQRTEEQASNLQQTAASREQLTATVKSNADTASQAAQLADSASAVATEGGEVVGQVVTTMGQISDASRRIADIIGTIDGIAFQTNILALNAAVEAARAGEQGRGFAVVAGEVRTLAQRSAQAAREIKQLITESVERVEAGSRQVDQAGSTMGNIVTQVKRVADLIGEITSASQEQSQGIGQVGAAVAQLDQVTQQNAALVEESAAAAESLKQQAARLAETVAQFRV